MDGRHVRLSTTVPDAVAAAALVAQLTHGADETDLADLEIVSPSLDDVFFHLASQGVPA